MKLRKESELDLQPVSHDPKIQKKVYLKAGEVSGILQWATTALKPGQSITEHMHPDAREIFHILKGEMRVTIEKESWNLPADSLLIIEPGERHSFTNHGSEDCVFVYTLMLCDQL